MWLGLSIFDEIFDLESPSHNEKLIYCSLEVFILKLINHDFDYEYGKFHILCLVFFLWSKSNVVILTLSWLIMVLSIKWRDKRKTFLKN